MMTMALLLLLGIQADSIERVIERLGDASIETRNQAETDLIRRAREWSDADVKKLERVQEDPDAEKAARSRSAIAWIRRFRTLPPDVWKAVPDLARRMMSLDGKEIGSTLSGFERDRSSLPLKALIPLLIDLLGDERDSGELPYFSSGPGPVTITVGALSARLLAEHVARFREDKSLKKAKDWWTENRNKPEREWHLADLTHTDEWVRAISARKLGDLKDVDAVQRLLDALTTFKEASAFAYAVSAFSGYPADLRARELARHLRDPRFPARFATAKVLPPAKREDAVRSVVEGFENSSGVKELPVRAWDLNETFSWLASTGLEDAHEALCRFSGRGSGAFRVAALLSLESVAGGRVEERLVEATSDGTTDWSERIQHSVMNHARACDAAAVILSRRLKIEKEFEWSNSIRIRNRNIETILNRRRMSRGLAPVEYHGPGIAGIPPTQVQVIIPDLMSKDPVTRGTAQCKLSELGPGAWRTLISAGNLLPPDARKALMESAAAAANSLRELVFEGQAAKVFEPVLRPRMHRPLDLDALTLLIGKMWNDIPRAGKLTCEVIRGADGIGFSIRLALEPADTTDRIPTGRDFDFENGSSWTAVSVPFLDQFKERLEGLNPALADPELQTRLFFTVERTYEKEP